MPQNFANECFSFLVLRNRVCNEFRYCSGGVSVELFGMQQFPNSYLSSFISQGFQSYPCLLKQSVLQRMPMYSWSVSLVPADKLASITFIHIAAPHCISLLSPFCCITGIDILTSRRETAAMEPRYTFKEPNNRNNPLLLDLYTTCALYSRINITWKQLEWKTTVAVQKNR